MANIHIKVLSMSKIRQYINDIYDTTFIFKLELIRSCLKVIRVFEAFFPALSICTKVKIINTTFCEKEIKPVRERKIQFQVDLIYKNALINFTAGLSPNDFCP